MKKYGICLLLLAVLGPILLNGQPENKGSLVISGGNLTSALDRIHKRFIELGGGVQNIRLAIIPAGSGGRLYPPGSAGRAHPRLPHRRSRRPFDQGRG
jgi:hypothetical protein